MSVSVGEQAPDFSLPDTGGAQHSLAGGPAVVVFTCNHCPYALAWHDRIADAARDYADRGVRFLAINSNDSERYPRDSYEAMQKRVAEEDWPLPYLRDESQSVARDYGAKTTPDVFVVDAEGRSATAARRTPTTRDPSQNAAWLRAALDAVLAGRDPTGRDRAGRVQHQVALAAAAGARRRSASRRMRSCSMWCAAGSPRPVTRGRAGRCSRASHLREPARARGCA